MKKDNIGLIAAIVIGGFILVNIFVASIAKKENMLSSIPVGLIDGYVSKMNGKYDAWLFGNSTLDNGVLLTELEEKSQKHILKAPLGSGNTEAMTLLAMEGIKSSKNLPKKIFLFVTKDDFNANGLRADMSKSYVKAITGVSLEDKVLSSIPLYSYRLSLVKDMQDGLKDLAKGKEKEHANVDKPAKAEPINTKDISHLGNVGRNYQLQIKGLDILSKICSNKHIELYVIMPPVTQSVTNWQDYYYPKQNYNYVLGAISKECEKNNIIFKNYTDSIASNTYYFKDEYHLNKQGASNFTSMLVPVIKSE